jgi:hypothetical protein
MQILLIALETTELKMSRQPFLVSRNSSSAACPTNTGPSPLLFTSIDFAPDNPDEERNALIDIKNIA